MKQVATRSDVFEALNSERNYQDLMWNEDTTNSGGLHTPTEWLVYMQDYLTQAMHQASRTADPESRDLVLNTIRKITAMGVACMEQNGAPARVESPVQPGKSGS